MNNTGKIYVIKNKINNKVYIGQTITPLKTRWYNHLAAARHIEHKDNNNMIIYNAMRKYGINNFYIELVEDNILKDKLNERETYWIKYYNSLRPNGYNILCGDENAEPFKGKPVYQLDKKTLKIIQEFDSIGAAAEAFKVPFDYISRVVRGVQLTTQGFRWCYKDKYNDYIENPPTHTNGKNYYKKSKEQQLTKVILQIDPETNKIIKEWYNGATEAADSLACNRSDIYKVLHGKRKTCGGFVWKYK